MEKIKMRTYPIDADRVRMISTGTVKPVTKWIELSDGSRRPDPQSRQDEDGHGRLLWVVECITPADEDDDRDKTAVTEITIASKDKPDAGAFGDLLRFEGLSMSPGYLSKKTNTVSAPRWTADGIRRHGQQQPKPQAA